MAFYGEIYAQHSAVAAFKQGRTLRYSQIRRLSIEDTITYVKNRKVILTDGGTTYHYIGKCPKRGKVWAKISPNMENGHGPTFFFSHKATNEQFIASLNNY